MSWPPRAQVAQTPVPARASAIDLVAFGAALYALRELGDELDAPLAVRALVLPLLEVGVVCALLRFRGFGVAAIGLDWHPRRKDLVFALAAVMVVFAVYVYIRPLVASLVGQDLNLSAFERIRGNVSLMILGAVQSLVIAGFREELLYRGFLMTRLAGLFQHSQSRWGIALVAQAVIFGLAHAYQGPTGMIISGVAGLAFGGVVMLSSMRLLPAMIAHGAVDSLALIAIYFGWWVLL